MTEQSIDLGKCMHCKLPLKPRGVYQNWRGQWVITEVMCEGCWHERELATKVIVDKKPTRGHRLTP